MKRIEALSRLKAAEAAIRAMGVIHLFLFGSVARDEAVRQSDVDIFFDRDPKTPFGLFELARLETKLEEILGGEVDVGSRQSLHPLIRPEAEAQAVQVF